MSCNVDFHFRLPTPSSPDFSYSSSPSCRRSCPARHLPPARNRDTRCSPGALEKITIPFPVETTTTIRVRLFNCESVGDFAFKTCVFFGATCTDQMTLKLNAPKKAQDLVHFSAQGVGTGDKTFQFQTFQQDAVNQRWDPSRRTRHKSLPDTDTEESA